DVSATVSTGPSGVVSFSGSSMTGGSVVVGSSTSGCLGSALRAGAAVAFLADVFFAGLFSAVTALSFALLSVNSGLTFLGLAVFADAGLAFCARFPVFFPVVFSTDSPASPVGDSVASFALVLVAFTLVLPAVFSLPFFSAL